MKKEVYINSSASLSAQDTFANPSFLDNIIYYDAVVLPTVNPDFKKYIAPAAARRMAKGVKMGVVTAKSVLEKENLTEVDAIITGTSMGCLRDSEKFLEDILTNHEEFLTPTSFIQSTHNTVAGQIAIAVQSKAYNMSYVHSSVSFESALIDAQLQLTLGEATTILVGGVDEYAEQTNQFHQAIGLLRKDPISTQHLIKERTQGTVYGEGASFFVISSKKNENSVAKLVDVKTFNTLAKENIQDKVTHFLAENGLTLTAIDALFLGNNGDATYDTYYDTMQALFPAAQAVTYKQLCGEYGTAASFGLWLAEHSLRTGQLPEDLCLNSKSRKTSTLQTILLYNQHQGENHSFILIQRC